MRAVTIKITSKALLLATVPLPCGMGINNQLGTFFLSRPYNVQKPIQIWKAHF